MSAPTLIGTIKAEMKLQILLKMPVVPLCRMRRTCSQMNSLIEENKEKLADRTDIGLSMKFVLDDDKIYFEETDGPRRFLVEDDFSEKISAISFKSLLFDLNKVDVDINRDHFSNFVQKIDITCDFGIIECENGEFVNELLNGITARTEMSVVCQAYHSTRFLRHINQTPKHEGISVSASLYDIEREGFFHLIKDYQKFLADLVLQSDFNQILKDIRLCKEPFIINEIMCLPMRDYAGTVPVDPPPMKILFDICPLEREGIIAGFRGCPTKIYQMDLSNGKCALVENKHPVIKYIYIVNNDLSEIFNILVKDLRIQEVEEEIRQAYIRADKKKRRRLLLTAFKTLHQVNALNRQLTTA